MSKRNLNRYIVLLLLPLFVAASYQELQIDVAGETRIARIYPGLRAEHQPTPLVLVFHGRGDNERNFSNIVKFHKAWPEATVVYPRGTVLSEERNKRGWRSGHQKPNQDLMFVDQLLNHLGDQYQITDTFVTGFSNGARFTFLLLAERPEAFSAFAPVGGLSGNAHHWAQPRPVMYLFGRDEPKDFHQAWAETVVALTKLNKASGETQEWAPQFIAYPPQASGALTVTHLYNAGHVWPLVGNQQIARFFRHFEE